MDLAHRDSVRVKKKKKVPKEIWIKNNHNGGGKKCDNANPSWQKQKKVTKEVAEEID